MCPKADTRLTEQLVNAEKSNSMLQAWFRLGSAENLQATPDPSDKVNAMVEAALDRAKQQAGEDPESVSIQPYLGTFTVYARPAFLRVLLDQPEIAQAGLTQLPGFGLIRPVESKPVSVPKAPAADKRRRSR